MSNLRATFEGLGDEVVVVLRSTAAIGLLPVGDLLLENIANRIEDVHDVGRVRKPAHNQDEGVGEGTEESL